MIEPGLYEYLSGVAAITAYVDDRIYPRGNTPQEILYPYITYERLAGRHVRHLTGGTGNAAPEFEINAWDRDGVRVLKVGDELRKALDNQQHANWGESYVAAVYLEDDEKTFESPTDGSKTGTHRVRMRFTIWHGETLTP